MKMQKIVVLVTQHQGVIDSVETFIGEQAYQKAQARFFEHTGVEYADYLSRLEAGEDVDQILTDIFEGTEIYIDDAPSLDVEVDTNGCA